MLKPCVLAFLLSAAAGCLHRGQAQESWDNLGQLRPGERIEVVDLKMKPARGDFASYTQQEIVLRQDGREITFARGEVASVKRVGKPHRRRNVLLGLAIGAAGGLATGAAKGKTYHEAGETTVFMAIWTPIGAGIGGAAGALLPAGGKVTIYRAAALRR